MSEELARSPYDSVGGIVWFPRMLDKIRLQARGDLAEAYHNNLGRELDGHCLAFLRVKYADLRERVIAGGSDEEVLEWCFAKGRRPSEGEIEIFDGFMRRLAGATPLVSASLPCFSSRASGGWTGGAGRASISSNLMKGRTPPDFRQWELPRQG